jgi:hypothetical protein
MLPHPLTHLLKKRQSLRLTKKQSKQKKQTWQRASCLRSRSRLPEVAALEVVILSVAALSVAALSVAAIRPQ